MQHRTHADGLDVGQKSRTNMERRPRSGVEKDSAVLEHGGDLDLAAELGDDLAEHVEGQCDLTMFDL